MMVKALSSFCFLILFFTQVSLGNGVYTDQEPDKITPNEYISMWRNTAIKNMRRFGIPASIILAQGLLESGGGNSRLARQGNNHFGIKCHSSWNGAKIYHDDDKKGECFRKYKNAAESYEDHAQFLKNSSRYDFLFNYKSTDYKSWAKGLKKAGYATNPKYPKLLIDLIERYELHNYDDGKYQDKNPSPDVPVYEEPVAEAHEPEIESSKEETEEIPNEVDEKSLAEAQRKEEKRRRRQEAFNREFDYKYDVTVSANNIKYIEPKGGEWVKDLAEGMNLNTWQIVKYNDLENDRVKFEGGEKIYIQPKRRKNSLGSVKISRSMSIAEISQEYGIKEKFVLKWNPNFSPESTIKAGTKVWLKRNKEMKDN